MEGLVLDLASLKRELQERKNSHSLKSSVSPLRLPAARQSPYRPYNVPASRQELVTYYTKAPVLRKPWKLQEYKRDAAALLVESLEKHFAKRWITLKTQSDSNSVRRPYIGTQEALHRKSPEGLPYLSADFLRFRTDRKAGPSEKTVSKAKVQNLSADLYGDAMLERLAMVSDRPSVPSPSPYLCAQKLVLALIRVLRRYREDAIGEIGLWGVKKAAAERVAFWLFARIQSEYKAAISCISQGKALEVRLFGQVLLRLKLRPYWEQLRLVTLRRLMAQLLALGLDKLAWVHQIVLRQAFSQLQTVPPPPPSPPLALKSVLQGLYMRRLQAAFNSTKRYSEHFQVHTAAKLALCMQAFHLARVKTLAKYLNRLRPASNPPANRPKKAAIGLLLVGTAFNQAQNRGIRIAWQRFETYSLFKRRETLKSQSATLLFRLILQISLKDCLPPLQLLRKATKYADLMQSGKKVVKRMIVVYLKDIHAKLGNGFAAWKRALVKGKTGGPEGPRISGLLGGLIRRRLEWGYGNLKGERDSSPLRPGKTRKAAAGVLRLVLVQAFRPGLKAAWGALALEIQPMQPNPGYILRAKASAARLIWKFTTKSAQKGLKFCLYRWKICIGCSSLVKTLLKRTLRLWERQCQRNRQFQRGIEQLAGTFRRKFAFYLQSLQNFGELSGLSSAFCEQRVDLSPSQALRLKLGLNKLQMHHSLVLKSALGTWKRTSQVLLLLRKQQQLAASALLLLTLHSLQAQQSQACFQLLLSY